MWQYWSHLKYTTRHKFYVLVECFKRGLYIRGITHDLSKFTPSEFAGYANFFFNTDGTRKPDTDLNSREVKKAFDDSWYCHQYFNDHHWQFWMRLSGEPNEMSKDAVDEMICDWIGAAKANYQNEPDIPLPWYKNSRTRMTFHENTRKYIEEQIGYVEGENG